MASSGLRSTLRPILYVGIALLLHGMLLLLPLGGSGRPVSRTLRGVRVHSVAEIPSAGRGNPVAAVSSPRPGETIPQGTRIPASPSGSAASVLPQPTVRGGNDAGMGGIDRSASSGVTYGEQTGELRGDPPVMRREKTSYDDYLDRLRSKDIQAWARESAGKTSKEWKGMQSKSSDWRPGEKGANAQSSRASKDVRSGKRSEYLDPRVRMVVTSYPSTGIVKRHTFVSYPEKRVKKHEFTSGWWYVYLILHTNKDGKVLQQDFLRPETDGVLERLFVEQVRREVAGWTFDPVQAEIHVDVRFYVE